MSLVNGIPQGLKKPVRLRAVIGSLPVEYAVVRTDIMRDAAGKNSRPVVVRSVAGTVGRAASVLDLGMTELKVPQGTVQLSSPAPELIASMVAAVDPKAGAVAQGVGALVDEGLEFIGDMLSREYGLDPFTTTVVELLPTRYYEIDMGTQRVRLKPEFKADLARLRRLRRAYAPVAERYNRALAAYRAAHQAWKAQDPLLADPLKRDEIERLYRDTLEPTLAPKVAIEQQLDGLALHRIALMAMNLAPGRSCESDSWDGPWRLHLHLFLGARQTNLWGIDYCVRDTGTAQDLDLHLVPNQAGATQFVAGGVRLAAYAGAGRPNIGFPEALAAELRDGHAPQTRVFSWFDELLTDAKGDGIRAYMLPFEVHRFRDQLEQERRKAADERSRARIDRITAQLDSMPGGDDDDEEDGGEPAEKIDDEKAPT